jgi:hypothetical protein
VNNTPLPKNTPLPIIRLVAMLYEICPDTEIESLNITCPMCKMQFQLTEEGELNRYATHFNAYWDTHKPDFITKDGDAVQIVRRI